MVWCGVDFECEHRSFSPKRENRIHPLDGERLQKKERKKGNAANLHEESVVVWVFYDGQRVFQKAKCEHVFIERV